MTVVAGRGLRRSPGKSSWKAAGIRNKGFGVYQRWGEDCGGRKWECLRESAITVSVVVRDGIVPLCAQRCRQVS